MRAVKVIATCFKPKRVVEKTTLTGDPLGYFWHSQNFTSTEDIINLLKFHIDLEKNSSPGFDRDIIIVNSNVDDVVGNSFINDIDQSDIPGGKVFCLNRENKGLSFGAYNDAFQNFKNDYDYFLFTEDDVVIFQDNYMKIGVDILNKNKKNGFVAYVGVTKIHKNHWDELGLTKDTAYSCHGAIGISSKNVLEEVSQKYGCLPHFKENNYLKSITFGEVAFPNSILKLGYNLVDQPKDLMLGLPAYDVMRGINFKKYPNILEIIIYKLKNQLYKIASTTKLTLKIYLRIISYLKRKS